MKIDYEQRLREYMWNHHSCDPISRKRSKKGEMKCCCCGIDFKEMDIDVIEDTLAKREFVAWQNNDYGV